MKGSFLFIVSLVLSPALAAALDPEPRKPNLVTMFLDEILVSVLDQISTNNISMPLIELGEAGKFSDVEGWVLGLKKCLDGVQSHGFKLNINATKALFRGRYDIQHLDLPGLFPVFGKGDFSIIFDVVNIKVTLKAVRDFGTNKFIITLPELNLQVENSKVQFDNLMDDPHLADFLNELLSNLAPSLLKIISDLLKNVLLEPLDYIGNGIFKCLTTNLTKEKRLECIKDLFRKDAGPVFRKVAADLVEHLSTYR